MSDSLGIRSTVKTPVPRVPFADIKDAVLGKRYELSLVLIGDALARRLNREHRNKTYSPNVLSFPISAREGEIFINVRKAEREAHMSDIPTRERIAYLFIHGLLHLKGLRHGSTMDRKEAELLRTFRKRVVR